ncbi:putative peptide zinc metalloprotease protein [Palleronia salina]|uniref:Putative peptide zinc metalloprotease protein n=1 Tax=Palleronia salina TaxID=313368 RepID=A0A1M6LLL6_9RHOB|nr:efflux RND transporter periplasmic adaptor subunit [Palleronia salina]SHJ72099.1 putative peptide zinc metalloprotease protein [Palleronia salina]
MSTRRSWSSASWYRVAGFRPRLRAHARLHRHTYRGQVWYVLQDRASGRFHRMSPEAHRLVAMMDGQRSLEDLWAHAMRNFDVDAVTQDELVRVVGKLYSADVLVGDVPPDIAELSDRGRRGRRQKLVKSVLNPLALRVPLIDPDDLLTATMPLVRPLFGWIGWALFFGVFAYALALAAINWGPLTENVVDRVLSTQNLILLLISYPAIKAVHELGHAYTIKRWGGHVHEIGVMFLVFLPVPYVDASDSIAFASKWRRALVGGAGILAEIFLASVAMIVWAGAEEGLVRAFAFNVMLIGGISTLLFNGNPLLRFDGYYVLSDLIEIPNLAQRANKYLGYLVQRHAFGLDHAESPVTARNERAWFVFYGIAAYLYRIVITTAIVGLVATRFFVIGLILAGWALFLMLILPMLKGLWYVIASPALRRHRMRALGLVAGTVGAVVAILVAVPVPHRTVVDGVVMPDPAAYANARTDGTVVELMVASGDRVRAGDPLVRLYDPLLEARRDVLAARVVEVQRRREGANPSDQTGLGIIDEELAAARADLAETETRIANQVVHAGLDGEVILPVEADLVGRYARRGDMLAVVAPFADPRIQVAVPETSADLVRSRTRAIALRFATDAGTSFDARVVRAAPGLSRVLPSAVLSAQGGGGAVLDPAARPGELRTFTPHAQLELALSVPTPIARYGERVHVRFDHGDSPVASRIARAAMRVFLNYFAATSGAA